MAARIRGMACHSCRQSVLRTFIRSLGDQSGIQQHSLLPPLQQSFSTSRKAAYSDAPERVQHANLPLNEINNAFYEKNHEQSASHDDNPNESSEDTGPAEPQHIPWYLQQDVRSDSIVSEENPLSARQRLPDLPDSPPPLLAPLMERVSVDLGMDDLSLLDLRLLDPPPALGANLLMLIGTARSEKHLHVSADRLCRWLRTEYHLTPYADGLLGRNELKLKLRRKAKRSRLLSAVGAKSTADTDIDDGIRTGWVCVNVGRVEGGELPDSAEKLQRAEGFVGFGAKIGGCSIVVQMLTEEKRGQMDLEKLWTGIMSRAKREKDKADLEDGKGGVDMVVPDSMISSSVDDSPRPS